MGIYLASEAGLLEDSHREEGVAIVVYALVAWLIVKVIWLAFGETRTAAVSRSTTVDTTRLR